MPFVKVPPQDQGATFVSLASMFGVAASQAVMRLETLAGQALPDDFDCDVVGFVLATRGQVESAGFMEDFNIGLAINCCGNHTARFNYRLRAKGEVEQANVPVTWAGGRMAALNLTLPYCVSAFVQKKNILVHCNQSFHRAPLGLAMLTRMLFGEEPEATLAHLASMRDIYYMYKAESQFHREQLWETLQWAKKLELWKPKFLDRPSSAWGKRSQGVAASQGQGVVASQGRAVAAAGSSGQGAASSSGQGVVASQGRGVAASQGQDEYLYRAMTVHQRELAEVNHLPPSETGLDLAVLVLDAVETGSQRPSPFLHFSLDFWEARKWQSRGQKERGERGTLVCRVSKETLKSLAASQGRGGPPDLDNGLEPGEVLDLSTTKATQKWLNKYAHFEQVQQRLCTLSRAQACKEVVVAWRGHLSADLFEVLDNNGQPLYFLSSGRFLQRACSKRNQLLGSENGCCVSF